MWYLSSFKGQALPALHYEHDMGSADTVRTTVELPFGRYYDAYGTARAPAKYPRDLPYKAIGLANDPSSLQTLWVTLNGLRGEYGRLVRTFEDASTHWTMARLLRLSEPRPARYAGTVWLSMDLTFQILQPWQGAGHNLALWTLDSGEYLNDGLYLNEHNYTYIDAVYDPSPYQLTYLNNGNTTQEQVKITLSIDPTTPNGTIQAFGLAAPGISSFYFVPPHVIDINHPVTIDCGARSIDMSDVANPYSYLSITASHRIRNWCELRPGANLLELDWWGAMYYPKLRLLLQYYDALE